MSGMEAGESIRVNFVALGLKWGSGVVKEG